MNLTFAAQDAILQINVDPDNLLTSISYNATFFENSPYGLSYDISTGGKLLDLTGKIHLIPNDLASTKFWKSSCSRLPNAKECEIGFLEYFKALDNEDFEPEPASFQITAQLPPIQFEQLLACAKLGNSLAKIIIAIESNFFTADYTNLSSIWYVAEESCIAIKSISFSVPLHLNKNR